MAAIHQLYCTHCTYGTSAVERREGELADRVLGYGARASSFDREELRKHYRLVERFLYYYLPADTPPDEKARLEAGQSPRRLVYYPSTNGVQVLGQISYRQKDTADRVGSYFAHLLVGSRDKDGGGRWSVLDCLKLWGAPWVDEDLPTIPFRLQELDGLEDLLAGARPAIDDGVLRAFLTTAPGQPWDDPRRVIPNRWRDQSAAQRAALLERVLGSYLELRADRRESVLVVVEPSLAALLFYGVARLLPDMPAREEISFSTFEPDASRISASLAATSFHAPGTDLRPEAYRRGFAYHTFLDKQGAEPRRTKGAYARLLVETLATRGFKAVDALHAGFLAAGAKCPEDLEHLAETHALVPVLLDPGSAPVETDWRQSEAATTYLAAALRRQLTADGTDSARLEALAGSPNQMLVLDLLAGDSLTPAVQRAMRSMLRNLPAERFEELLTAARIPLDNKVKAVADFAGCNGRLPEGCEALWAEAARGPGRLAGPREQLLPMVLAGLAEPVVERLRAGIPAERVEAFLVALALACQFDSTKKSALNRAIQEMSRAQLLEFLRANGERFAPAFPKGIASLGEELQKLLAELHERPKEFSERLDLLRAWVNGFPNPGETEPLLAAWNTVRTRLEELVPSSAGGSPGLVARWLRKSDYPEPNYNAIAKDLVQSIWIALPSARFQDDDECTGRQKVLRRLGEAIARGRPAIPERAWYKVEDYFRGPTLAIRTGRRSGKSGKARLRRSGDRDLSSSGSALVRSTLAGFLVVLVAAGAIGGYKYFHGGISPKPKAAKLADAAAKLEKDLKDLGTRVADLQQQHQALAATVAQLQAKSAKAAEFVKRLRLDALEADEAAAKRTASLADQMDYTCERLLSGTPDEMSRLATMVGAAVGGEGSPVSKAFEAFLGYADDAERAAAEIRARRRPCVSLLSSLAPFESISQDAAAAGDQTKTLYSALEEEATRADRLGSRLQTLADAEPSDDSSTATPNGLGRQRDRLAGFANALATCQTQAQELEKTLAESQQLAAQADIAGRKAEIAAAVGRSRAHEADANRLARCTKACAAALILRRGPPAGTAIAAAAPSAAAAEELGGIVRAELAEPEESADLITDSNPSQPRALWTHRAVSGKSQLVLEGLAAANRRLASEQWRLVADPKDSNLAVSIQPASGPPATALGRFYVEQSSVLFRWFSIKTQDEARWRRCRECLRMCLVEVKTDSGSQFLALDRLAKFDALALANGVGRLDTARIPTLTRDMDLYLGGGRLHLADGKTIQFATDDQKRTSRPAESHQENSGSIPAVVSLVRSADRTLQLRVELRVKKTESETEKTLSSRNNRLAKINANLDAMASPKKTFDDKMVAAGDLAALLGIAGLPPLQLPSPASVTGKDLKQAQKKFQDKVNQVKKKWLTDTTAAMARVAGEGKNSHAAVRLEIDALKEKVKKENTEQNLALAKQLGKVTHVSAFLYRVVETKDGRKIRVDEVVIGTP